MTSLQRVAGYTSHSATVTAESELITLSIGAIGTPAAGTANL